MFEEGTYFELEGGGFDKFFYNNINGEGKDKSQIHIPRCCSYGSKSTKNDWNEVIIY